MAETITQPGDIPETAPPAPYFIPPPPQVARLFAGISPEVMAECDRIDAWWTEHLDDPSFTSAVAGMDAVAEASGYYRPPF